MLRILILLAVLCRSTLGQITDPCDPQNYDVLDDPWRSAAYVTNDVYKNDVLISEGWYRSVSGAGGTIPSSAPQSYNRCGTRNPVWMFDTLSALPSDGVTKSVNVCGKNFFIDCSAFWQIKVKNCGAFYLYYLTRPPGNFGYCFGTETQCPDGETSATGFTPGCKYALDTNIDVAVTTGLEERIGKPPGIPEVIPQDFKIHEIKFECNVHFPNGENPALFVYDVDWYINDNLLTSCSHTNVKYNDVTTATRLKEECWRNSYTLGFLVRCAMRLRKQTSGQLGERTLSSFFNAGFETDKREYTVAEGEAIDVRVRLTVPLGCYYPENAPTELIKTHMEQNCIITIRLQEIPVENVQCTSDPIALKDTNCGLTFNHTHWDTPQTLTVYGASDNLVNVDSRSMFIKMSAKELVLYHNAWNSASIPSVLVTVDDLDKTVLSGECFSRNDPHMRTFDGRYWENQRIGEFVLYKHNERPYWVHAVYQPCSRHNPNGVTCNCGVAIRNNDALFVANFCRENIGWSVSGVTNTNRYIEKSFCDDTSMTIQENRNTYTITLPTGTKIAFNYYSSVIRSIIVKPSLADWKSSSGLCGFMDGTFSNEFRLQSGKETTNLKEFALDWKIKTVDQSLFRENIDLTDAGLTLPRFCKCSEDIAFTNNVTCTAITESNSCVTQSTEGFFKTCDSTRQKRSSSTERYKRGLSDIDVIPKFPLIFGSDIDDEPQSLSWRNGWDAIKARIACIAFLTASKFLQKCTEVLPGVSSGIDEGVTSCMEDIRLIGDTRYMETTVASLAASCRLMALKLENLTKTESSNGTTGKTLLDEMLELDCPNNCSGNGDCFNGSCVCTGGFEGHECSLTRTLPPVVSSETNPGLCAIDKYPCRTFYISGENFARTNVTCKAVHFSITAAAGYTLDSKNETFPANALAGGIGCSCTIPESLRRKRSVDPGDVIADGFFLSVSNDGLTFSDDIVVIRYDSSCYTCNTTAVTCAEQSTCQTSTSSSSTTITTTTPHQMTSPTTNQTSTMTATSPNTISTKTDDASTTTSTTSATTSATTTNLTISTYSQPINTSPTTISTQHKTTSITPTYENTSTLSTTSPTTTSEPIQSTTLVSTSTSTTIPSQSTTNIINTTTSSTTPASDTTTHLPITTTLITSTTSPTTTPPNTQPSTTTTTLITSTTSPTTTHPNTQPSTTTITLITSTTSPTTTPPNTQPSTTRTTPSTTQPLTTTTTPSTTQPSTTTTTPPTTQPSTTTTTPSTTQPSPTTTTPPTTQPSTTTTTPSTTQPSTTTTTPPTTQPSTTTTTPPTTQPSTTSTTTATAQPSTTTTTPSTTQPSTTTTTPSTTQPSTTTTTPPTTHPPTTTTTPTTTQPSTTTTTPPPTQPATTTTTPPTQPPTTTTTPPTTQPSTTTSTPPTTQPPATTTTPPTSQPPTTTTTQPTTQPSTTTPPTTQPPTTTTTPPTTQPSTTTTTSTAQLSTITTPPVTTQPSTTTTPSTTQPPTTTTTSTAQPSTTTTPLTTQPSTTTTQAKTHPQSTTAFPITALPQSKSTTETTKYLPSTTITNAATTEPNSKPTTSTPPKKTTTPSTKSTRIPNVVTSTLVPDSTTSTTTEAAWSKLALIVVIGTGALAVIVVLVLGTMLIRAKSKRTKDTSKNQSGASTRQPNKNPGNHYNYNDNFSHQSPFHVLSQQTNGTSNAPQGNIESSQKSPFQGYGQEYDGLSYRSPDISNVYPSLQSDGVHPQPSAPPLKDMYLRYN